MQNPCQDDLGKNRISGWRHVRIRENLSGNGQSKRAAHDPEILGHLEKGWVENPVQALDPARTKGKRTKKLDNEKCQA
jgi:hypothetical protein